MGQTLGPHNPKAQTLITPFLIHYFNCTIFYPLHLLLAPSKKIASGFPSLSSPIGLHFQHPQLYLQARWLFHYNNCYDDSGFFWLWFLCGPMGFVLTQGQREGLRGAARRVVRACGVSELLWGDCLVAWLGRHDFVMGRARLFCLHFCEECC